MLYDLHSKTLQYLTTVLPAGYTCMAYPETQIYKKLPLPCLVLEMVDFEPAPIQPNDERSKFTCRFEARIVNDPINAAAELTIRETALKVAHAVRNNNYGMKGVGFGVVVQSGFDALSHEFNDSYLCWVIEFTHDITVGEEGFTWWTDNPVPLKFFVGFEPDTGPDHIEDYTEVT